MARSFSDDALRDELARETDPHRALQLVSLGPTRWLPDLGWIIHSPRFERGVFAGCSVPPIPELLDAAVGLPAWATANALYFHRSPRTVRSVLPVATRAPPPPRSIKDSWTSSTRGPLGRGRGRAARPRSWRSLRCAAVV